MKNTLHTPGPWAIHTCNENGPFLDSFYLSTPDKTWDDNEIERIICRFPTGTLQFSDMGRENLANARLISAAPDLLETLQDICAMIVSPNDTRADILAHAQKAIAKAMGEA